MASFLERNIRFLIHMRQRMFRDNRLGLCLGAGVSADFAIPRWKELIERIAAHPVIEGNELLKVSESLTAQSQFLYQKYLQSLDPAQDEDEVVRSRRVHTGWLKIVHEWASPASPDTSDDMMCTGESYGEHEKALHGRVQA